MTMDVARKDQLLADVIRLTGELLTSSIGVDSDARSDVSHEAATLNILVEALCRHHEPLWPSSQLLPGGQKLAFQGVVFDVIARPDMWDPAVLDIAYVPPSPQQRIESRFSTEFPLGGAGPYSSVRIYPPRAAFAFEFQIQDVADVAQAVLNASAKWISQNRASS
jgi:hypothetical protein